MNVGIVCPNPEDGTSFYRGHGVFGYLSRECGIRLMRHDEWAWPELLECDLLFLQRPSTGEALKLARSARACRIPLWVEHDDDLSAIPPFNPAWSSYNWPPVQENIRQIIACANVVTVATPALQHIRADSIVIPNALNTYIWPFSKAERQKVVTWRGTKTHWFDMEPFIGGIKNCRRMFGDWQFVFLGQPHPALFDEGRVIPQTTMFDLMANYFYLAPAINIVPLVDCHFNRVKSNIAWLEATAAGAVTLAPDFPEWQRPGIVHYRNPDEFEERLRDLMLMDDHQREEMVQLSREYIAANLTLSVVNQRRIEILKRFAVNQA